LDRVIRHTVVHQSSTSIYIPNFIEIRKTFCGRTYVLTYVPTDGHFRHPLMLLGRLLRVHLITLEHCLCCCHQSKASGKVHPMNSKLMKLLRHSASSSNVAEFLTHTPTTAEFDNEFY